MIEVVYKGEHKGDKNREAQEALPKNIRQIGEGGRKDKKIYIEDYVVTYMNQLSKEKEKDMDRAIAVLLGEVRSVDKCRYIFINGALSIDELDFHEETWDKVHQQILEYFEGLEVVGWYFGEEESGLFVTEEIGKIHSREFPGEDKVLILKDFTEGESAVFLTEDGGLEQQKGYYIYFEKNLPMQEYMIAVNNGRIVEEQAEDKDEAIQNFRKISEKKEKEKLKDKTRIIDKVKLIERKKPDVGAVPETKKSVQPFTTKLLYAASTFLVLTVLIIGVTLINNYDKMKNMEVALNGLSQALQENSGSASSAVSSGAVMTEQNTADVKPAEENLTESEAGTEVAKKESETQSEAESENASVQNTSSETEQAALSKNESEQPAKETLGRASYVVKEGDSIAIISQMYYGSLDKVEEICELNGITDVNRILPGQKLLLP